MEYLLDFIEPLVEGLKLLVCWFLNLVVIILSVLLAAVTSILPDWPVPSFLQAGLGEVRYFLEAINWVVPLGVIGPLFAMMFSFFVVYFVAIPFYRGIMDLL